MKAENVRVEYGSISEQESDELLYQVYELLLRDDMHDTDETPTETGYNQ